MKQNYDISKTLIISAMIITALCLIAYEASVIYQFRYLHQQQKYSAPDEIVKNSYLELNDAMSDIDVSPYINLYTPPIDTKWTLKDFQKALTSAPIIKTDYIPNLGFSFGQEYWGHVTIKNRQNKEHWLLQIQDTMIDHFDLYAISESQAIHTQLGRLDKQSTPYKRGRFYTKELTIRKDEVIHLYFKVHSTDSYALPLKLYQHDTLNAVEFLDTALLGLYYGTIICTLFFVMIILAIIKDRTYFYYLNTLLSMHIVLFIGSNGILSNIFPSNDSIWIDKYLIVLGLNTGTFFFILFSKNLLCRNKESYSWKPFFNMLLPLPVISTLFLLFTDNYTYHFIASNINSSINPAT